MIAGAGMLHLDNRNALRIYRRDRSKHKSPNAGQTESVCAGALHIQLGGDASYFGKIVKKAAFGDPDVYKRQQTSGCRRISTVCTLAVDIRNCTKNSFQRMKSCEILSKQRY